MTTPAVARNVVILSSSDVSAMIVGAGYAAAGAASGGALMVGVRSIVISVLARMASQSTMMSNDTLNSTQKNEIVVAILGAVIGYARKGNPITSMLSAVSIDLLAVHTLQLLNLEDKNLLGGGGP